MITVMCASTCCCKGGTGFQASFKMDLDVEADTVYKGIVLERNAKCGLWFQTIGTNHTLRYESLTILL